MFYNVVCILHFIRPDEARDFYHDCQLALTKADVINPGQPNQECSMIERLDDHHDTDPNQPCIQTEYQDNCPVV